MYCMNFWLVFPKFQGQALNFHLVEAAELLNYLSPLYGPDLYNYIWNFESHIYYFWEVQTKTSIRSNNINFFFLIKKEEEKKVLGIQLTADELFIWSFNKPQVVGNQMISHYECSLADVRNMWLYVFQIRKIMGNH